MATSKNRINISVSKSTQEALKYLAKRDQEPVATKARNLLELALEIEEDFILGNVAAQRLADKKSKRLSHEEVWKGLR